MAPKTLHDCLLYVTFMSLKKWRVGPGSMSVLWGEASSQEGCTPLKKDTNVRSRAWTGKQVFSGRLEHIPLNHCIIMIIKYIWSIWELTEPLVHRILKYLASLFSYSTCISMGHQYGLPFTLLWKSFLNQNMLLLSSKAFDFFSFF